MTEIDIQPRQTAATEEELLALLDKLGIEYQITRHKALFTVEDGKDIDATIPGGHSKNLFLKAKKGGYFLASCLDHRAVKIRDLGKAMGAKNPSFGKPEDLYEYLGVRPGSVTAFSLLNDPEGRVTFGLDEGFMKHELINFHPLHNEATLTLTPADLLKFIDAIGHQVMMVDFDTLEAEAAAKDAAKLAG